MLCVLGIEPWANEMFHHIPRALTTTPQPLWLTTLLTYNLMSFMIYATYFFQSYWSVFYSLIGKPNAKLTIWNKPRPL